MSWSNWSRNRGDAVSDRRLGLLKAIDAEELYQMRVRVDGKETSRGPLSASIVRARIFNNWDRYADELQRWIAVAFQGNPSSS